MPETCFHLHHNGHDLLSISHVLQVSQVSSNCGLVIAEGVHGLAARNSRTVCAGLGRL